VIVVVVTIVVVIAIAMSPAAALCFFKLLAALVGLATVFAVTLDGGAPFLFGLMDAPFAALLAIVAISAGRHR
jgi:nicotinamide riboside transporter PnuC